MANNMWARLDNHYIEGSTAIDTTSCHHRTDESPVAEHFNGNAHFQGDMVVVVIDHLWSNDSCLRIIWESRWIRTLATSLPWK